MLPGVERIIMKLICSHIIMKMIESNLTLLLPLGHDSNVDKKNKCWQEPDTKATWCNNTVNWCKIFFKEMQFSWFLAQS